MDLGLTGKRVLITGASKGLGYATARALALEGAQVAMNSSSEANITAAADRLRQETGETIVPFVGDVTDPAVTASLVSQTVDALGGLDILITNAGGPPAGAFESFDEATWQHAIELSFMSHVRLIRAALPALRQSDAASVLTITSISVKQPIANLVLSNSIRAATVGLTKTLSLELGEDRIRFNSILPSWTETERVYNLMSHRAEVNGTTMEEEMRAQSARVPLGRMGRPEEFANVAAFLVSPASSYLNGVMLSVDGGGYGGLL
jgi:3-oxoacyl-[acyl-carrier protein] reductase